LDLDAGESLSPLSHIPFPMRRSMPRSPLHSRLNAAPGAEREHQGPAPTLLPAGRERKDKMKIMWRQQGLGSISLPFLPLHSGIGISLSLTAKLQQAALDLIWEEGLLILILSDWCSGSISSSSPYKEASDVFTFTYLSLVGLYAQNLSFTFHTAQNMPDDA
jgi:hypothetical protein